ncbi:MAG TPA: metallophosphoesterase, partial [Candidatus Acidoferrum sp.]|nr:metallophosphoesterase [Candidatus Acidoferrum sp.]
VAPLQLYLFKQVQSYIKEQVKEVELVRKLSFVLGCLFIVMQLPALWRGLFGLNISDPYSQLVRGLFTASTIWAVGSIGAAAIFLVYNLFQRFNLLSRAPVAVTPDPARREFLKKGVGLAAAAPFMVSGYGALLERRKFEVDHFTIPVPNLSSELNHLTVVQLSDIHVGPFMPPEELAEYVEAVNRLKPDIIALTGDFVTGSESEVVPCAESLARLQARYGVFACMGNHDVYARAEDKLEHLFAEKGIETLRNNAKSIRIAGSKVSMLGIDDLERGHSDLRRALTVCEREPGEVKVLLSHRPEVFPAAAKGDIDLVLPGHYHGGQVKLSPTAGSLSVARLLTPYADGLFRLARGGHGARKTSHLFVSRGIGITGVPIRINCPPQIAHLRLIKA